MFKEKDTLQITLRGWSPCALSVEGWHICSVFAATWNLNLSLAGGGEKRKRKQRFLSVAGLCSLSSSHTCLPFSLTELRLREVQQPTWDTQLGLWSTTGLRAPSVPCTLLSKASGSTAFICSLGYCADGAWHGESVCQYLCGRGQQERACLRTVSSPGLLCAELW